MPELSLLVLGAFVTALAVIACILIGRAEAEGIRQAEKEQERSR